MEFGYWDEKFQVWPMFRDRGMRNNAQADVLLGIDRTTEMRNHWIHPPFPSEEIRRAATTRIVRNSDGLFAELPLDRHDAIPCYLEAPVTTPSDWAEVKAARFRRDDPARVPDIAALRAAHPAEASIRWEAEPDR